jgi:hypothetical protein
MDNPVLEEARRSFRVFYNDALPDEATWMDSLVLAWVALRRGVSIPREVVPAADRGSLERACDDAERNFMQARERVQACATFRKLCPGDTRHIAVVVFELYPPTE